MGGEAGSSVGAPRRRRVWPRNIALFMEPAIRLRGTVALVGRYPVLAGADLEVRAGEVVVVAGANGAGKTSLLRVCAGLLAPNAGEAEVLGVDLRRSRRELRGRIGFLSHESGLYEDLTLEENLRFALRSARRPLGRLAMALERTGLPDRLRHRPVRALSAGQRRRADLASLVARAPELWLLDEPHANLDPDGKAMLTRLLAQAAEEGAAVLVASHEPELLRGPRFRPVRMAGGRLVDPRPPEAAGWPGEEDCCLPPERRPRVVAPVPEVCVMAEGAMPEGAMPEGDIFAEGHVGVDRELAGRGEAVRRRETVPGREAGERRPSGSDAAPVTASVADGAVEPPTVIRGAGRVA